MPNPVVMVAVEEIKPYPKNAKKHPPEQVEKIANSIKENGWRGNPILLDKENVIVAGHGRLMAAKLLEMKEVPCEYMNDLDADKIRKFRLTDNKVGETGYLKEELQIEVHELNISKEDLIKMGWKNREAELLLNPVEKVKPELSITPELFESHNYVVLYFDNELDWKSAMDVFGLKSVKTPDSKDKYMKAGIGRVIDGKTILKKLL